MAIVLGLSNAKDSGAALIIDGVIVAAANEERFTRKKLTPDFPFKAYQYILDSSDISPNDIDYIGVGMWNGIDSSGTLPQLLSDCIDKSAQNPDQAQNIKDRVLASLRVDSCYRESFFDGFTKLGLGQDRLFFCDHHNAHALTASYFSEFDSAAVFTMDGRGDFLSSSFSMWNRSSGLLRKAVTTELNSLGALYGWVTCYLGFIPNRHEGKVTGLAAR